MLESQPAPRRLSSGIAIEGMQYGVALNPGIDCLFSKDAILEVHNTLRSKHLAPELSWSDNLSAQAQGLANSLLPTGCSWHPYGALAGNVAWNIGKVQTEEQVVQSWYNGFYGWDFNTNEPQPGSNSAGFVQVSFDDS
eukprot:GILJ01025626.1.p1 GENE.GILJ01025626.1~~GILJ01025626.1.p1  ORF type:complete len:138 (+),score=6.81 GILJ01025626.1:172-585(+)